MEWKNHSTTLNLYLSPASGLPRQSPLAVRLEKSARKAILRIHGMLLLEKGVNPAVRFSQAIHFQIPRVRQIKCSIAVHSELHQLIDQFICLRPAIASEDCVEVKH